MIRRSFLKLCASVLPACLVARREPDRIVSVDRGDHGKLFDAYGRHIQRSVEANLTTGRCVVFKTDQYGNLIHNRIECERMVIHCPAPMRFERRGSVSDA